VVSTQSTTRYGSWFFFFFFFLFFFVFLVFLKEKRNFHSVGVGGVFEVGK
jgi:hypothetical protein